MKTILARELSDQFDATPYPAEVGAWLQRALSSDPDKRFPDAMTMQEAWREAAGTVLGRERRGPWWRRIFGAEEGAEGWWREDAPPAE